MEAREKLKRSAKWISVLLGALIFISLVGIIYSASLMASPERLSEEYDYGGQLYWRDDDWDLSMARLCVFGVVQPAFLAAALIMALKMFRDMHKRESPFTADTVRAIRRIGVLIVLLSVLSWPIGSATVKLIWAERVAFPFLISVNVVYLLLGIIVCCLSAVFNYGYLLQQESDETL